MPCHTEHSCSSCGRKTEVEFLQDASFAKIGSHVDATMVALKVLVDELTAEKSNLRNEIGKKDQRIADLEDAIRIMKAVE